MKKTPAESAFSPKTAILAALVLFLGSLLPSSAQEAAGGLPSSEGSSFDSRFLLSTRYRTDLSADSLSDIRSAMTGSFFGHIGPVFSYTFTLGFSLDRINPETFSPYTFTKETEGFHFWPWEDKYSDGINDHLNIGSFIAPDLTFRFQNDAVILRWAKERRNWGVGEHSLFLSDTARPFDALEGAIRPADWVRLNFLTGSLGDWTDKNAEQKMYSLHRVEFTPFPWLYLAGYEAAVWGKRFELSYMNPLMSYYVAQNIVGDQDNIALGGEVEIDAGLASWYFSLFLDEIETDRFSEFLRFPKNQYAFQTGLRVPLSDYLRVPSEALFQYTKLEPYVYTHYPQQYPFFTGPVNIAFTHDGENLGYPLPPNSDEFLVRFTAQPRTDLELTTKYRYIRHGTGRHENGQIEGDIDIHLDYGNLEEYPDKDFLNDGIYEYIHALMVSGTWKPGKQPVAVSAEYSYVRGTNFGNIEGNTVTRNLLALGLSYTF